MSEGAIEDYMRTCTVSLWNGQRFLGSGFFAAANTIATCAHVLRNSAETVTVEWQGQPYTGHIIVKDPERYSPDREPRPDVAFIGLVEPVDHPTAFLTRSIPRPGDRVTVMGYSRNNPTGQVAPHRVGPFVDDFWEPYIRLVNGNMVRGLSGSLAFDSGTGDVVGMAKSKISQEESNLGGGWLISAEEVRAVFRRHHVALESSMLAKPTLIRPRSRDTLHALLVAQRQIAAHYPYKLAQLSRRPVPPLSTVYVEPRTQPRRKPSEVASPGGGGEGDTIRIQATDALSSEAADTTSPIVALTPIEMLTRHRHALVVGAPGSGKSTLLRQLVATSAEWWLRDTPPQAGEEPPFGRAVAVRVAATHLLRSDSWYESMAKSIKTEMGGYLTVPLQPEIFTKPPANGAEWLVLVDGLDEVLDYDDRIRLINMVNQRIWDYAMHPRFVVASRQLQEAEFGRMRSHLAALDRTGRLGEYRLKPFDQPMLDTFANNWFRPNDWQPAEVSPEEFLDAISDGAIRRLVEVPLLATIAAVVYEEAPTIPLAGNRNGLYDQFVKYLLTGRNLEPNTRRSLLERISEHGAAAEAFAEHLYDNRRNCLQFIADRVLEPRNTLSVEQLAEVWLRDQSMQYPEGVGRDFIREYLLSTGLLEPAGSGLTFVHQSLSEYLASELRAASLDPDSWKRVAATTDPTSMDLFTLGHWTQAGNDPVPIMNDLAPIGTDQALSSLAAVLEDGAVGTHINEVVDVADKAVRSADPTRESTRRRIGRLLMAMQLRSRNSARVMQIATAKGIPMTKRVEAAKALALDVDPQSRADGIRLLAEIAYGRERSIDHRMMAMRALLAVPDEAESKFALQHLLQVVQTHHDPAVVQFALILLRAEGYSAAALVGGALRAVSGSEPLYTRTEVLFAVQATIIEDMDPNSRLASDPMAPITTWYRSTWTHQPTAAELFRLRYRYYGYLVDTLSDVIDALVDLDSTAANRIVRTMMHNRTFTRNDREHLAHALHYAGRTELANLAHWELAGDQREQPSNRIKSLLLLKGAAQRSLREAQLLSWVYDSSAPQNLRFIAFEVLSRTATEPTERLLEVASRTELPLLYRIKSAYRYASASSTQPPREILRPLFGDRSWPARFAVAIVEVALRISDRFSRHDVRQGVGSRGPFTDVHQS
jgi:hypothetical protein